MCMESDLFLKIYVHLSKSDVHTITEVKPERLDFKLHNHFTQN